MINEKHNATSSDTIFPPSSSCFSLFSPTHSVNARQTRRKESEKFSDQFSFFFMLHAALFLESSGLDDEPPNFKVSPTAFSSSHRSGRRMAGKRKRQEIDVDDEMLIFR